MPVTMVMNASAKYLEDFETGKGGESSDQRMNSGCRGVEASGVNNIFGAGKQKAQPDTHTNTQYADCA